MFKRFASLVLRGARFSLPLRVAGKSRLNEKDGKIAQCLFKKALEYSEFALDFGKSSAVFIEGYR
jgi:hypothetical protein